MKIIDRYIMWLYVKFVLMGIIGFVLIYLTVDLIDHIHMFLNRKVTWDIIAKYYYYQIPSLIVLLTPVSILLSCFFTLGKLAKNFEIIAMQSLGISSYRIMMPVIIPAFVLFIMLFYLNEFLVPQYARKFWYIKEVEVNHSIPPWYEQTKDYTFKGSRDDFYYARIFDPGNKYMEAPAVVFLDGSWKIITKIDAQKAEWQDSVWKFTNCYVRKFNPILSFGDSGYQQCTFVPETLIFGLASISQMTVREVKQDEMSIRELWDYLARVTKSGARPEIVRRILVDINKRAAYPVSALVIVLIGAPLALDRRRSSIGVGFGLSLLIAFVYWGILQIGLSMGYVGTIPPLVAGWGANLVFIALGLVLFVKVRR